MTIRLADPLPECALCERPTQRAAHDANGGLCTPCATGIADTVRMLPVRDVADAAELRAMHTRRQLEDDDTVIVEGYRPPVPGQLALTDDGAGE